MEDRSRNSNIWVIGIPKREKIKWEWRRTQRNNAMVGGDSRAEETSAFRLIEFADNEAEWMKSKIEFKNLGTL